MFLDHVTLAVHDLDETIAGIEKELSATFEVATDTIPGITGRVVALDSGFLEIMAVSDPERATLSPFGKKFVQYLAERGPGVFSATLCTEDLTELQNNLPETVKSCGPISTWVPQPDGSKIQFSSLFFGQYHLMPWVIEYHSDLPEVTVGMRLSSATVQVAELTSAARHYQLVYGIPDDRVRIAEETAVLQLHESSLKLRQAAPEGLSEVEIEAPDSTLRLAFGSAGLTLTAE
ncbi:VOC family protein [Streptomyces coelicoflavus]|uniref:VOC family protein n=1 Tax=Streptomyces coelicoflavus TaxID=285562 RepID=A0A7K3PMT1_9ACTN|nr:VOC family protein [Streptomyces coelicoflavus]NEB11274.1 VOC family protein [Streptomyces coelicoflavus]